MGEAKMEEMTTLDRFLQGDEGSEEILRLVSSWSPTGYVLRTAQTAEDIEWFTEPGGQIILSTKINARRQPGILGQIKSWVQSVLNTWQRVRKSTEVMTEYTEEIQRELETPPDIGWSIGPGLYQGRYISKTGEVFDEKSFVIDIRNAPMDEVILPIAQRLGEAFQQESVLIVDHGTGRSGLYYIR